MTTRIQLRTVLLSVVALSTIVQVVSAQSDLPVISSYELVKTDLTANEPVLLRFTAENVLDYPVEMDLGVNFYGNFQGRITRPDGRVEMAREGPRSGPIGKVSLLPHAPSSRLLLLNRWFDFDAPGRYTVNLKLTAPVVTDTGTRLQYAAAREIVIDIRPRDPARLQGICAGLEEAALKAPSYAAAAEATETLSYVRDPTAVPALSRLVQSDRMVEVFAIGGLERIGDGTAVEALIPLLNASLDMTRDLARSGLWRLAGRTQDRELRQEISKALAEPRERK